MLSVATATVSNLTHLSCQLLFANHGLSSGTLQYLDQEDLKRYLDALVEHRDHFVNDPSYLKVFQEGHLSRAKSDKKKDAE